MSSRAVLASRSGSVAGWVSEAVEALGYDIVETVTTASSEHGRYHLPPGVVDELETTLEGDDRALVVIDESVHPGQLVDIAATLGADDVRDRRGIVFERLAAGGNDVAETRLDLYNRRIERRRAEQAQRQSATQDPTGTSGRVEDLDRRCQQLQTTLETQRRAARRRTEEMSENADGQVVLVGSPTVGAPRLWSALTGADERNPGPFEPARPVSARRSIGAHWLTMTATPGLIPGDPEWYRRVVPGTFAALRGADIVVVVGRSPDRLEALCETVGSQSEATVLPARPQEKTETGSIERPISPATPQAIESCLQSELATVCVEVTLPYGDEAQALVSQLYDRRTISSVEYSDEIALAVEIPEDARRALRRQVSEVGGSLDSYGLL